MFETKLSEAERGATTLCSALLCDGLLRYTGVVTLHHCLRACSSQSPGSLSACKAALVTVPICNSLSCRSTCHSHRLTTSVSHLLLAIVSFGEDFQARYYCRRKVESGFLSPGHNVVCCRSLLSLQESLVLLHQFLRAAEFDMKWHMRHCLPRW